MDIARFVAVLKRISFFETLSPEQAKSILQVCEQRSLDQNSKLCTFGDPSSELFILVSGKLSVRTKDGVQIAVISPIAPVGEMGLFTGEPRSATVTARESCSLLVLGKSRLDSILRRSPDLELRVSRNLIRILSQRLRDANAEVAHLQELLSDLEEGTPTEDNEE